MQVSRALSRSVEALLERKGDDGERYIDLGISLRICNSETDEKGDVRWLLESDEELLVVGGRWDRRLKQYVDKPALLVHLRVHRGQEKSARWIAEWIRRRAIGKTGPQWAPPMPGGTPKVIDEHPTGTVGADTKHDRDFALLLIGGRRSGKSHVSCLALVMYAVMHANALIWAISPALVRTNELKRAMMGLMPPRWYRYYRGGRDEPPHFRLANGSVIVLVSGHKAEGLKNGRCNLALYNEGQNMSIDGFAQLHGAIGDDGGLVLIAANPPSKPIGRWIEDLFFESRAGKNYTQTFQLSPRENPFIDYSALTAMSRNIMDPVTFRREVLGEMLPIGDVVFHSWSSTDNVALPPEHFVDITPVVTKRVLGRAFGDILGLDFQRDPANAGTIYRFYQDPDQPDEIFAWVVDEFWCEDSNELELLDEIERRPRWKRDRIDEAKTYRGWVEHDDDQAAPVHCGVVMDASAWWQDGAHNKGKQSDRILRSRNWKYLYQPQPWRRKDGQTYRNNPPVVERCKVANALMLNAAGVRRMFVAPHCTAVIKALKNWPNTKSGLPDRISKFAHLCDAATYPLYRLFAKVKPTGGKQEVKTVGDFSAARDFSQI